MEYSKFEVADYLDSEDAIAAYLNAVIAEGDPALFRAALGDIAKVRGIGEVSKLSGLNRESLYKTLKPGAQPKFDTIFKIMHGLHMKFHVKRDMTDASESQMEKRRLSRGGCQGI